MCEPANRQVGVLHAVNINPAFSDISASLEGEEHYCQCGVFMMINLFLSDHALIECCMLGSEKSRQQSPHLAVLAQKSVA